VVQVILIGATLLAFMADRSDAQSARPPFRVAVARFSHETCTFCPGGDTDVERWTRIRPPLQGDEVLDADSYIRGFVARVREYGKSIELLGLQSPYEVFGSSSASWITQDTFEHFMELILHDLREVMPVDGVYLALHGAMAVRNIPRPEAEVARRVREVVGPDVPIVATFDLHGNEDEEFLKWADMAFVTKRYPHYDSRLQGERAARALVRAMRGEFKPTTATRKPGIITATVLQWTGQSPAMDIMERARRWEARQRDVYVSVFFGYPWSDVADVGATVMVVTHDNPELAHQIADDMSEYIWRVREEFARGDFPKPADGVRLAREAIAAGRKPVAIGDYSDRPGDATHILRELINQGVEGFLYATLRDEAALEALKVANAKPGDRFSRAVGGFTPSGGEPVTIEGTLVFFGEMGPYEHVAAVEFGEHNMLLITPTYTQITSPEQLRHGPIDPDSYDVIVVKSRVHFRRGFDETGYAKTILVVDAPGPYVGTTALDALDYEFAPIEQLYPFGEPERPR
jgi:microcystin degradation protein MlrC